MANSRVNLLLLMIACCALASSAFQGGRLLKQRMASAGSSATAEAENGGSATAGSSAISTGGTAVADAFSSTRVVEQSAGIFVDVTNDIVDVTSDDIGNCTLVTMVAETAISEQAEAVAAVFVEAVGTVDVTGDGEACADSAASGEASASAFAAATAKAIVETLADKAQAGADAVVSAIAAGTAEAFANAFASTCTTGGFGLAEQTAFGKAIVRPMVEVYALAIGGTDCQEEAVAATAEAIGEGESMVKEEATAGSESNTVAEGNATSTTGGDAGASTDVAETAGEQAEIIAANVERCSGTRRVCCTSRIKKLDTCTCTLNTRSDPKCNMEQISGDSDEVVWRGDDVICKC